MYLPVRYSLAAFHFLNIYSHYSPFFSLSFPSSSYPTFPCQMAVAGTSSLAVGVLWLREKGGEMGGGVDVHVYACQERCCLYTVQTG